MSRSRTLTVLIGCLLAGASYAQRDFSSVEMQSTKVAGNVYMLVGAGGNIGVTAGDDGLLIVDDQFAPLADKIRAALREIHPGELSFVLNTHWHGDHTGSNAIFGREATIIAHENVRTRLSTEQTIRGNKTPPSPPEALPVVTFEESVSVHFNGEEIELVHLPAGHTDGDSAIFFRGSNVAHLGDHYFAGRFPFVDLESGGSVEGMARNIGTVLGMIDEDTKIVPGHGPLSSKSDLETYHRMLVDTIDTVKTAKAAGRSLEEIQKAGFSDAWDDWGAGFINAAVWAQTIFASLD